MRGVSCTATDASSPRIDASSEMFSRPVSSTWKPAPTSRSGSTDPHTSTRPAFGTAMPAMTCVSVDFPDPFWPTIPKYSPRGISNVRSSRAWNDSGGSVCPGISADSERRRLSSSPSLYVLLSPVQRTARGTSDEIGEANLQPPEDVPGERAEDDRPSCRDPDRRYVGRHVEQRPSPGLDHPRRGVEREQPVDVRGRALERVADGRHEDARLHDERHDRNDVAEARGERRQ